MQRASQPLYKPLDTIRLLKFIDGSDPSTIYARLEPFALNSSLCPPFLALSYVWGTKSNSHTININGHKVGIWDGLYSFVEFVQHLLDFSNTWWWIDSICINQEDGQEKSLQIQIMGKIYARAEKTIVWLGHEIDHNLPEESRDCTRAIDTLERLEWERFKSTPNDRPLERKDIRHLRDSEHPINWKSVERLLLRPWWRRVWTLQEFLICDKVMIHCGYRYISRRSLQVAMFALWAVGAADGLLMDPRAFYGGWNRRRINQWYRKRKDEMGLVAMLAYVGDCGATDDRDRVYSLLGVARDSDMIGQINTRDSVDIVYAKLVRSFIARYNSLDIIDGLGGTKYNDRGELISDINLNEMPLIQSNSAKNYTPVQDFDLMEVISRCLVLDREDRYLGNNMPPDFFRAEFIAFCKASSEMPEEVHALFFQWFQMNKSLKIRGGTIEECTTSTKQQTTQNDFKAMTNEKGFLSRFRDIVAEMARRLVTMRAGHVGMAPCRSMKGDMVCLLYGCSIPVLLRERESGSYEFIGEVYVDGFMNGEGLDRASRQFRLE